MMSWISITILPSTRRWRKLLTPLGVQQPTASLHLSLKMEIPNLSVRSAKSTIASIAGCSSIKAKPAKSTKCPTQWTRMISCFWSLPRERSSSSAHSASIGSKNLKAATTWDAAVAKSSATSVEESTKNVNALRRPRRSREGGKRGSSKFNSSKRRNNKRRGKRKRRQRRRRLQQPGVKEQPVERSDNICV